MLYSLKVKSIRLMTNNPNKIESLTQHGVVVTERIPHIIPPNPHNQFYLETKAAKSGHLIDLQGKEHLLEQCDHPIVEGMTDGHVAALTDIRAWKPGDGCFTRGKDDRCYPVFSALILWLNS